MGKQLNEVSVSIPFPLADYQELREMPCFMLIFPFETETASAMTIDKMVRAVIFENEDYMRIANAESPSGIKPEGYEYYEIEYTRDCALRSVISNEWRYNYSCTSLDEYLSEEPTIHTKDGDKRLDSDSKVRVVCLRRVAPNLKELNKRYGIRNRKN